MTGDNGTPFAGNGKFLFNGSVAYGPDAYAVQNGDSYSKFRMWGNSSTYAIGMHSGQTYGYLADYAMTFQMNNSANRGWKWQYENQGASGGAMSLTTDGRLYIEELVNTQKVVFRRGGEITSDGATMRFIV